MKKSSYLLLSVALLIAQPSELVKASEIGLWYTGANPDYKPFSTDYGFGLTWEQSLTDTSSLSLLYNETDFNPSGPVVGRLIVKSWTELAYRHQLDGDFYIAGSYTSADTTGGTYDGLGIHVGHSIQWTKHLSSKIQVGHIDTKFSDYQLEGSLTYQLSDDIKVALKLRDFHEWDYTAYEAGFLYSF